MRKFTLLLALLVMVPTVVEAQGRRQRVPDPDPQHRATDWIPLSQSMTELLNAGWKIISHAHYQTEVFNSNPNIESFSFILTNGNRYVICMIDDPVMNNTTTRCRALN